MYRSVFRSRPRLLPGAGLAVLMAAACTGTIGSSERAPVSTGGPGNDVRPLAPASPPTGGAAGPGDAPAGDQAFVCAPGAPAVPGGLRRLSAAQLRNSLSDLAALALGDTTAARHALAAPLAAIPDDSADQQEGHFRRLDGRYQQAQIEAVFTAAGAAAAALTTPARLTAVVGACATDGDAANDAACLTAFLQRFGARALRRPLSDEDLAFYRGVHGNAEAAFAIDPAGVADVITALLSAPEAMYLVEHGEGTGPVAPLAGHELASRLSFALWDTIPDDALWAAAQAGTLASTDALAAEVDRLVGDPRAQTTFESFFREWLELEALPPMDSYVTDPRFKAFAGAHLPTASLRGAMIDDTVDFFRHHVFTEKRSFSALLTGDEVFPRTAELAAIYGVPVWAPPAAPPRPTGHARPGFITRAAVVAHGTPRTRPIIRGVFLRESVLCDAIPPPPPNANMQKPEELAPDASTRAATAALTEVSVCAGCHAHLINPLGFTLESFDALGRFRTEERILGDDGRELSRVPVDSTAAPEINLGDGAVARGADDLARLLLASGKPQRCLSRQLFRFTYGRRESEVNDACALEPVRKALAGGAPMTTALRELFLTPAFRQRAFD